MREDLVVSLVNELRGYGPAGLFVLAFISNLVPGFPAVYLSLLASYAVISGASLESLATVLGVGVAAGLGKFALFALSKHLGSRIEAVRRRRELFELLRARRGGVALTVFLFAALPLPDDLLYIPLGVAGFNTALFLVSVVAGKIAMAFIVFTLGSTARWAIELSLPRLGELTLTKISALVVATIVPALLLTYIVINIDWLRVYKAYAENGEREAAKTLAKEVVAAITFRNMRVKTGR